jgi:hypothetical protein
MAFSPQANYADRATTAYRRSQCQRLRIDGVAWWDLTVSSAMCYRRPDGHCLGHFCIYNNFFPTIKKSDSNFTVLPVCHTCSYNKGALYALKASMVTSTTGWDCQQAMRVLTEQGLVTVRFRVMRMQRPWLEKNWVVYSLAQNINFNFTICW